MVIVLFMNTATITNNGITYNILQIKSHSQNFTNQIGWTHFAEVKKPNGRKSYFANILFINNEVIETKIIN